ncbi:MAG TPA: Ig-like domain-containing protein [Tepidisphaeraceae bacterium]|nr:Ig-like domain-containing protein [Tepidisphaeraceae bacterium]
MLEPRALLSAAASASAGQISDSVLLTPLHLAFVQQPANLTDLGAIQGPVTVAIEDQNNQVVASDDSSVTLSLPPGSHGTLTGTMFTDPSFDTSTTVAAVNGIATFSNLNLYGFGSFTLVASDGDDATATSTPVFNPITPTITFASSDNQPNVGQMVTFSGTIGGEGNIEISPTGTVTIENGDVVMGTATVSSQEISDGGAIGDGVFSVTVAAQAAWNSGGVLTVNYSGDANFAAISTSPGNVSESVSQPLPLHGSLQIQSPLSIIPGQRSVPAIVQITNTGAAAFHGQVSEMFYVSATGLLDASAMGLPMTHASELKLAPGKEFTEHVRLHFPANAPPGVSGMILQLSDQTFATNVTFLPDSVTLVKPYVHLAGAFSRTPVTGKPGAPVTAAIVVTNAGNVPADGDVTIHVQESASGVFDDSAADDLMVTKKIHLGIGQSMRIRLNGLALPATPGNYFLVAELAANAQQVPEIDANANTFASNFAINVA